MLRKRFIIIIISIVIIIIIIIVIVIIIIIIIIIINIIIIIIIITIITIRVCHPNADSYRELSPNQIFQLHENERRGNTADGF